MVKTHTTERVRSTTLGDPDCFPVVFSEDSGGGYGEEKEHSILNPLNSALAML